MIRGTMPSLSNYVEKLTEKIETKLRKKDELPSCFHSECLSTNVHEVSYPLQNRSAVEKEYYCLNHLPEKVQVIGTYE